MLSFKWVDSKFKVESFAIKNWKIGFYFENIWQLRHNWKTKRIELNFKLNRYQFKQRYYGPWKTVSRKIILTRKSCRGIEKNEEADNR